MVNKENMRLWVAGLRSGRFAQGRGALKVVEVGGRKRYCCLGVACEIAKENGVPVLEAISISTGTGAVFYFDWVGGSLPFSVREWLGVGSENPIIGQEHGNDPVYACQANDGLPPMTFEQIAYALVEYYRLEEPDGSE